MHTEIAVERQPVHDRRNVVGYELLFGGAGTASNAALHGDQMTASVIFGALSLGLDKLVGDGRVFVKADRSVLTGELPLLIPPRRTVVEVVESVRVDDEVLRGCRRLAADGFTLAVSRPAAHPSQDDLLPLAGIVKVDLVTTPSDALARVLEELRGHHVTLFAEHVMSPGEVPALVKHGFELFGGPAFEQPSVVTGRALVPRRLTGRFSAAEVLAAEDFDALERILRQDPALTHQVLQLASLGRIGETRRAIRSIRDALVLVGSLQVRNWLAVLLLMPTESLAAPEALARVLQRARACELLAGRGQAGTAFAAGMLSAVDQLLEVSRDDVAAKLALGPELREAAFGGHSPLAHIVFDISARQSLRDPIVLTGDTPVAKLDRALSDGLTWAQETRGSAPAVIGASR